MPLSAVRWYLICNISLYSWSRRHMLEVPLLLSSAGEALCNEFGIHCVGFGNLRDYNWLVYLFRDVYATDCSWGPCPPNKCGIHWAGSIVGAKSWEIVSTSRILVIYRFCIPYILHCVSVLNDFHCSQSEGRNFLGFFQQVHMSRQIESPENEEHCHGCYERPILRVSLCDLS